MSNHYAIGLLDRAAPRRAAERGAQNRLGRLARLGQPRQPRWWERLMLSRSHTLVAPTTPAPSPPATPPAERRR